MIKFLVIIVGIALGSVWGYFNLGKWLDITQKPVKSDVIICLGGGDWHRYSKAVSLFEKGYAEKKIMVLTGADVTPEMRRRGIPDGRITDLKKHHPEIAFVYLPQLASTRAEVRGIKEYMLSHHYESALIVTDPPHTRRFSILVSLISLPGDDVLKFHYVSSGVPWWHKKTYYQNRFAKEYALTELLKIPYNIYLLILGK